MPAWAQSMIRLGHEWADVGCVPGHRKIGLLSLPCESPCAGLAALGALTRNLGDPAANDVDGHYDALLRHAYQYLNSCRDCHLRVCDPKVKQCGYSSKASGKLRAANNSRKMFTISSSTDFENRQIAWETPGRGKNGPVIEYPGPQEVVNYHIEEEPPVQIPSDGISLPEHVYKEVVEGAKILPENLRQSYSGLCFAGRTTGEVATRSTCDTIHFQVNDRKYRLSELLTIKGWSNLHAASRMVLFNPRVGRFDRSVPKPKLVIADGDVTFLKVLARREFQWSDVIGVIHRSIDRDRLENIGKRMLELRQWYAEDTDMIRRLAPDQRGANLLILSKATV